MDCQVGQAVLVADDARSLLPRGFATSTASEAAREFALSLLFVAQALCLPGRDSSGPFSPMTASAKDAEMSLGAADTSVRATSVAASPTSGVRSLVSPDRVLLQPFREHALLDRVRVLLAIPALIRDRRTGARG